MADPNMPDFDGGASQGASGAQGVVEKFRGLPRGAQIAVIGVAFVILYVLLSDGGSSNAPVATEQPTLTSQSQIEGGQLEGNGVFETLNPDRQVLFQGWLEQSRREMSELRDEIRGRFDEKDVAINAALEQNAQLQREMRQMLTDFTAEMRSMEAERQRDREIISQHAEEIRGLQLNEPVGHSGGSASPSKRRSRISQTPLGSAGGASIQGKPLLGGVVSRGERVLDGQSPVTSEDDEVQERLPFVPPLGFIRGTLLNGVDALVGGAATPALVRLEGKYKTAMNSTVTLDGCFMLVEFEGEISTERAIGKPSRMTCVYPDQGATTYSVSGYVVDSEDGIIGVPGVFYEGDATRIAAAMLADFAAGVAEVIEQNQNTFTASADGNSQQTLTGDQTKAEIAGGAGKAVSSLRDYLFERASRVLPFVRIDSTRDVHLVLLSGTELRSEGSPWTLLFAADDEGLN